MPERFEFPEGATPIGDCSGLIPVWVHHLNDLNRVEAENIMNAQRKYLQGKIGDPPTWFQVLNFVFQNLKLDGKNLFIDSCQPFTTLVDYQKSPKRWGQLDSNQRSPKTRDLQSLAIAAMRHPLGR